MELKYFGLFIQVIYIKLDYYKEIKFNKKWDFVFKSKNGLVF